MQRLAALRKRADVFLYQRFQAFQFHIAHNHHRRTGRIGKEAAVHPLHRFQRDAVQHRGIQGQRAIRIGRDHLRQMLLQLEFGTVLQVRQVGPQLVNGIVELVLVETRLGEFQIKQLESGLQVFPGGITADSVEETVDEGLSIQLFAGEHLGHVRPLETRYAGVLPEQGLDRPLEGRKFFRFDQALTTLQEEVEENLVFFVLGGQDHHLDAVGQDPLGRTIFTGQRFLDAGTLQRSGIQEFPGDLLPGRSRNLRGLHFGNPLQQVLFGRSRNPFFFRTGIQDDAGRTPHRGRQDPVE